MPIHHDYVLISYSASRLPGSASKARYPRAVYGDLVLHFYGANYFHQKGHRSEAAKLAAAK